jgi:hypothetical protein
LWMFFNVGNRLLSFKFFAIKIMLLQSKTTHVQVQISYTKTKTQNLI